MAKTGHIRRDLSGLLRPGLYICLASLSFFSSEIIASPRDVAKRIHDRLTGIPPSAEVLLQMDVLVRDGKFKDAALLAIENPAFYNITLKNWVTPWTNISDSSRAPLNDYTATVIGMVRDDLSFDRVLYDDVIYTANGTAGVPAYSSANNTHYQTLQTTHVDLKAALVKGSQSALSGLLAPAGIMTTRAFGEAFFSAGTNRRALRSVFKTYLCRDMEQLSDTTRRDDRVRKDVDRSPGGDSSVYRNKCAGCHAGMDALGGAFAYYDFTTRLIYAPNAPASKYGINANVFPEGYQTLDDSWQNLWLEGHNESIGWRGAPAVGAGAKDFGRALSKTAAFSSCMAEKVYSRVCLADVTTQKAQDHIKELAEIFESKETYSMKNLFAETAARCLGE
jgi:hypothetical protein